MSEDKEQWRLSSLELKFNTWGEDEGKYTGKIEFRNGLYESFSFRIRPDMAEPYIDLIASDIVTGAESLGKRLIESLGLEDRTGCIDTEKERE